ncbi:hypothetical protein SAMN05216298_1015 [Glycomyces sambucus]|uniref:Uncharacterized protein n=2 Tax=Glycomyces sambucus TaxID=380244 RepID=A0A1G9DP52_9ACTN|nr:hypothetical protein SAMN05216298_1015 [Glycomyces sambucus]
MVGARLSDTWAMTPPREGRDKPRSISLAQAGLWLQFGYLVGGGLLSSAFVPYPFGALMLAAAGDGLAVLLLIVGVPALGMGAGLLTLMIADGFPGARTAATVASLVLAAAAVAVSFASPIPWITFATALPWFALQAMTVVNLRTAEADRWFSGSGPVAPEP